MINKIFIIHHPSLLDRKKYLDSKIEFFNLKNVFWENFIYTNENFLNLKTNLDFKNTEVSYRHYKCLKEIISNNYEYSLILEDDVILELLNDFDINEFLKTCVTQMKEKNCMICFSGITDEKIHPPSFDLQNLIYHEDGFTTRCCHSYIISKEGAKLLYNNFNYCKPVDHMYHDIIINNNIKSFYTKFGFKQGSITGKYKSAIR